MCDDITELENQGFYEKLLTRRDFNLLAGGAAISVAFAGCAPGEQMETKAGDAIAESDVMIETPDGMADAYFAHPSKGAHAAVLIWAVDTSKGVGTTGYCMGGPMTMLTAHERNDRVRAGASFHGGGLNTDKPDSPHLLIPEMNADYLIAIAENDDERNPESKNILRAAFDATDNAAEIEVYAGTKHGWCPPDSAVYDEAMANKAWAQTLALFEKSLA